MRESLLNQKPVTTWERDLLSRFSGTAVLVLGDVMLDEYLWGVVSRISPEAPIPIVDVQEVTHRPGGAANVAAGLAALGARPILVGVVGEDEAAGRLRSALEGCGIATAGLVADPARPTTTKTRIIAHSQQVVRADHESRKPLSATLEKRLITLAAEALAEAQAVVVSDYAKGVAVPSLLRSLILQGRERGLPLVVDPKGTDLAKYQGATVVTPNKAEAARASKVEIEDEASLAQAGRLLLEALACQALLITRGEEGMSLFEASGSLTHLPASAREVYDVTGAGDTVVSAFTLSLACGASLPAAAHVANQAAGVVVGKLGTATVTLEELMAALGEEAS